ncbi:7-cyano-7-deazaguanine synthase QueC [Asaia bogorensis]|uniref:7-cyano-7-deazaguanine synthase n=1 Tax=Asaia bogorensis NBRC 16594 TaxID=1231624 RepID=A0AAN4R2A6_9PROT|nr:7-cyano-7-deazaguanine synthase QueC [Asaia bogorensis]BAT18615.1 queuosine biosynthesis protein QueC/ExsB [Asaia bogorensis NBRC 16594]GBQ75300.1 queuosine biosynthesis protein QueC/ExsB [Asaia bogorensis NBRC 16594]GEL52967.1 7-cyano-7-deazaguanine synthase [Asaia bogorensis NBRC 16594]
MLSDDTAIVLFSGGQDSATCLAWALDRFAHVETLGFAYGQRHAIELECRDTLRDAMMRQNPQWRERLGPDHTLDLSVLGRISETALTREAAIEMNENGLPSTFVPGRNLLFLSFAATLGVRRNARHIVTGVCETDYSGYPDCRDDTIKALQVALNLGMETRFVLHTPLMWLDKAETWRLAERIGGDGLVALINRESHSCYMGDRAHLHDWGYGCGTCPACELRAKGWASYVSA